MVWLLDAQHGESYWIQWPKYGLAVLVVVVLALFRRPFSLPIRVESLKDHFVSHIGGRDLAILCISNERQMMYEGG